MLSPADTYGTYGTMEYYAQGHRQPLTVLRIVEINSPLRVATAAAALAPTAAAATTTAAAS